jgi:zinc transport system substrate-binding protein
LLFKKILPLLVLIFILVSCGQPAAPEGVTVVASIYPLYDFATKIGGDRVQVVCLLPPGGEPHDWEPSPTDIAGLAAAQVLVYNGAGLEPWLESLPESITANILMTEASAGIELLPLPGQHSGRDPHVWLNPLYALREAENICAALSSVDPANAAYYEANLADLRAEFLALDEEFRDALAGLVQKDIVVTHAAFAYLTTAYGLRQVALEGMAAESDPTPARMAEIIEFVQAGKIKFVFYESLTTQKIAQTVAEASGADIAALRSLESVSAADQAAGNDYMALMRLNLAALQLTEGQ